MTMKIRKPMRRILT